MPKFGTSEYVLYQENKNNFGVFLCVIVYRLFVLNFWWCILRNIVNISSPSQQCLVFLTRVIFTMSVFPLCYAPAVPRELGGGITQIWGVTLKKFLALRAGVCAPNFKTVSAPMVLPSIFDTSLHASSSLSSPSSSSRSPSDRRSAP